MAECIHEEAGARDERSGRHGGWDGWTRRGGRGEDGVGVGRGERSEGGEEERGGGDAERFRCVGGGEEARHWLWQSD